MSEIKEEIIKAYFGGGNAKDKSAGEIKQILQVILAVIDEESKKEG